MLKNCHFSVDKKILISARQRWRAQQSYNPGLPNCHKSEANQLRAFPPLTAFD